MLRVAIADDHPVINHSIQRLIEDQPDMVFAGQETDGRVVIAKCEEADWDILVLDIHLGETHGVEVLREIRSRRDDLSVVVFSRQPEERYLLQLLRAGAAAYINKSSPTSELLAAIRAAGEGRRHLTKEMERLLFDSLEPETERPHLGLTNREYQVFLRLVKGATNKAIGAELNLGKSTVSTYVGIIKRKLQVDSVAEMVAYAIRERVIE